MTTLAEYMLAVARVASDVFSEGTATAGTTSSLTDTVNLIEPGGYWTGGVLFLKSCTQTTLSGTVVNITGFGENKLSFATLAKTITAGDTFSISFHDFSRIELKNAVLAVLNEKHAEQYNATLTATSGTTAYDLPSGINNVRRVIVDGKINQHWHEINSQLVFPTTHAPTTGTIELIYSKPQGDIAETATVHAFYDFEAVKWSALMNLYRRKLNILGNDDPVIMDKMKEASSNEQRAWNRARHVLTSDMRLS